MLYNLTYINNRGESIEFNGSEFTFVSPLETSKGITSPPFKLVRFEGFGGTSADVQLQKSPYQDGSTHIDTLLEEGTQYLDFIIVADNYEELSNHRRKVSRVFNPKVNGQFLISIGENEYVIESIPESVPFFADEDIVGKSQRVSVNLIAPNPYWQDIAESKTDISTETGNLEFPLEIPAEGLELSIRTISFITNIYNHGDVDTPIKVRLKATGTVINPIIENLDTGEYIMIKRDLAEGDTLEINTAFGNKRVEIVKPDGTRENVFHYIDYKSTFFQLSGGDNTIKYDAEVGENNLDVSIYYTPNYLGI